MTRLETMVEKLGRKVQPADDFYKFSPIDLEDEILEAMVFIDPGFTVEGLTPLQEMLVMYKARSSCYYTLAGKHAENIRFRIENDEYFSQQAYEHYMGLGARYESMFKENVSIQVNTATRRQTGTGLKAPYDLGDTP